MYLYSSTKILLVLLLELKEIFQARAVKLENEITKPLDKWFASILTLDADDTFKLCEEEELENYNTEKRFFKELNFGRLKGSKGQLDFKFSTNNLQVFHEEMNINIYGTFKKPSHSDFKAFDVDIEFENVTITNVVSQRQFTDVVVSTNFSYDRLMVEFRRTYWARNAERATNDEEQELQQDMPALFGEHLANISKLTTNLNVLFQQLVQPRNELISEYSNFLDNLVQFYYLVPRAPFFCFVLKRIVIYNLGNLDSFKMHQSADLFTHILLVNDIKGSMILDYKSEKEEPLKLKFKIGNLYVMKKQDTNCVSVQAKFWKIVRADSSLSLSSRQSQVLINGLESAIASSILSSVKVGKVCDIESTVEAIKITNVSDWETVKKSYKGWIPFNDEA